MAGQQTPQDNRVSTVLGRKLGGELQRLRAAAGLTQGQAAKALTASTGKVAKMESGWVPMRDPDIRTLCHLYGEGDPETVGGLLELARIDRERRKARGWWTGMPLTRAMKEYIPLENAATTIRTWQMSFIPGLLQTADYARALRLSHDPQGDPGQVEEFVKARIERQRRLSDAQPLSLYAVVPEAALRYLFSHRAMARGQLDHLLSVSELSNVTVRVLPFDSTPLHTLSASFNVLSFAEPGSMDVVYAEQQFSELWIEGGEGAAQYNRRFTEIADRALTPSQSRSFVNRLIRDHAP